MRIKSLFFTCAVMMASGVAFADLVPFEDYDVSDAVWSVTTIKVDPNMGDAYLEGIERTWAASNQVAQDLGQIESYSIFRSIVPESGEFNLLLIVKFSDTADLAPSKERYDAFMREWGEQRNREVTEYAQESYPDMRKITGAYLMREVTLK